MDQEIEVAILSVIKRIKPNVQPDEALKCSQTALNLAHLKNVLNGEPKGNKTKAAS